MKVPMLLTSARLAAFFIVFAFCAWAEATSSDVAAKARQRFGERVDVVMEQPGGKHANGRRGRQFTPLTLFDRTGGAERGWPERGRR